MNFFAPLFLVLAIFSANTAFPGGGPGGRTNGGADVEQGSEAAAARPCQAKDFTSRTCCQTWQIAHVLYLRLVEHFKHQPVQAELPQPLAQQVTDFRELVTLELNGTDDARKKELREELIRTLGIDLNRAEMVDKGNANIIFFPVVLTGASFTPSPENPLNNLWAKTRDQLGHEPYDGLPDVAESNGGPSSGRCGAISVALGFACFLSVAALRKWFEYHAIQQP